MIMMSKAEMVLVAKCNSMSYTTACFQLLKMTRSIINIHSWLHCWQCQLYATNSQRSPKFYIRLPGKVTILEAQMLSNICSTPFHKTPWSAELFEKNSLKKVDRNRTFSVTLQENRYNNFEIRKLRNDKIITKYKYCKIWIADTTKQMQGRLPRIDETTSSMSIAAGWPLSGVDTLWWTTDSWLISNNSNSSSLVTNVEPSLTATPVTIRQQLFICCHS